MATKTKDMRRRDLGEYSTNLFHPIPSHPIQHYPRAGRGHWGAYGRAQRKGKRECECADANNHETAVVPYQEPAGKSADTPEMTSTLSSTLPMAAIFTRNRYIGW